MGRVSYYLFLAACVGAIVGVAWGLPIAENSSRAVAAAALLGGLFSGPFATTATGFHVLWAHQVVFWAVVTALLMSSVLARVADHRIRTTASRFWYEQQPALREALENARVAVLASSQLPSATCWGTAAFVRSLDIAELPLAR